MPTSKTILGPHLVGFIFVAWLTLLAETIHPPLAHDFSYLVAGTLGGYLFVVARDRQCGRRLISPGRFLRDSARRGRD